jgi:Na+/H+ antiporter NhaD/arsenite permease-like protein
VAAPVDGALPALNGAVLSLRWGVPFAGLLLSIAVLPIVAPQFWHAHYGKITAAWVLVLLIPLTSAFGFGTAVHEVAHVMFTEYVPFIIILFALFTISGGICLRGQFRATPARNTALLALGATLASIMGTTGAAMLLIRPLLAANEGRKSSAHAVVFFILLVGNIGGALSPLGDPPLFIGFLKGVGFFWTTQALLWPTLLVTVALLAIFYLLDRRLFAREPEWLAHKHQFHGAIEGSFNFVLLAGVVGAVLISGLWKSGITLDVLGTPLAMESVVRDVLLVVLALASLIFTPKAIREHNVFHWAPIVEVAKLFVGIFVTIIPVIAILGAGRSGALRDLIAALVNPDGTFRNVAVFWVTGILSAFLDNAPTYLVFFNLAAGNAATLMGPLAATLKAISMAAVYFGALTYIGNAPNFMIKAIAEDRGVAMPSFFAYLGYSAVLLVPLLALIALFAL